MFLRTVPTDTTLRCPSVTLKKEIGDKEATTPTHPP